MHAHKHNTQITGCANPLANHMHRLSLPITLQPLGSSLQFSTFFLLLLHIVNDDNTTLSLTKPQIFNKGFKTRQWIHSSLSVSLEIQLVFILELYHWKVQKVKEKVRKKNEAVHPLHELVIHTHAHGAYVNHLPCFPKTGKALMCDMLLKTTLIIIIFLYLYLLMVLWEKNISCTISTTIIQTLPYPVEIQHTSTSCTTVCWLHRKLSQIFQHIFLSHCICTK